MSNIFTNLLSRIRNSGLGVRLFRGYHYERMRTRHGYWQSNSIYLDNIYNKIATDVAMMRFKHIKIVRRDGAPDLWNWFEQSDLANVLSYSANDDDTPIIFWADVTRALVQKGIAVVVPKYSKGVLVSISLAGSISDMEGNTITVQIEDAKYSLQKKDVWIFRNPKKNLTTQLNQITKLIDDNLAALSYKINEQPQSKLRGFLKLPTKTGDEALKARAEKRVQSIFEASRNGGIGALEQGEEFQELTKDYFTADPEELEFLKAQLYQSFGINEALFTCNYTEDQYRAYFQSVLKLFLRVFTEEINRKAFTATARTQGHRIHGYFDMFDIVSLKDISDFTFKSKYSALMSSNELRENCFGLPPYEGGDVYESNLNAVQIGQSTGGNSL